MPFCCFKANCAAIKCEQKLLNVIVRPTLCGAVL